MRHFKDSNNNFFGVDADQDFLIKSDWVEVTTEEIAAANAPTPEQEKQNRIYELRGLLRDSDFKVLPDYDQPNEDIKQQRQAWRNELRQLGG